MRILKSWLRLLTAIPLLIVLVGTNYYEDPANISMMLAKAFPVPYSPEKTPILAAETAMKEMSKSI